MTVENDKTRAISSEEIRKDIEATEREIDILLRTIDRIQRNIEERRTFVTKLLAILHERQDAGTL